MENPCYQCKERTMDCHSECKKYSDFVVYNNSKNEQIRRERQFYDDYELSRKNGFKTKKK